MAPKAKIKPKVKAPAKKATPKVKAPAPKVKAPAPKVAPPEPEQLPGAGEPAIGPTLPESAPNVIVVSDLASPVTISHSTDRKKADDTQIKLALIPGANFFDKEDAKTWLAIKTGNRTVIEMLEEGTLRELITNSPNAVPESLAEFDAKMAVDVVRGTASAEVLKKWIDEEDRQTVIKPLQAQLKIIIAVDERRAKAQKKAE